MLGVYEIWLKPYLSSLSLLVIAIALTSCLVLLFFLCYYPEEITCPSCHRRVIMLYSTNGLTPYKRTELFQYYEFDEEECLVYERVAYPLLFSKKCQHCNKHFSHVTRWKTAELYDGKAAPKPAKECSTCQGKGGWKIDIDHSPFHIGFRGKLVLNSDWVTNKKGYSKCPRCKGNGWIFKKE